MSDDTGDKLSKNDLYILMESYKNNIQLNTTLLEQQKQLMVMNNQSIDKLKELCEMLDKFIENLSECSKHLTENHNQLLTKMNTICTQITTDSAAKTVENSKLTNRINIAMGGMITIIISIIGLAITYTNKIDSLITIIKNTK